VESVEAVAENKDRDKVGEVCRSYGIRVPVGFDVTEGGLFAEECLMEGGLVACTVTTGL